MLALPELEEMTAITGDFVLLRALACAYVETAHLRPRKRGPAFVEAAARHLSTEGAIAALVPIRGASKHAELLRAEKEATNKFDVLLPVLVAAMSKA